MNTEQTSENICLFLLWRSDFPCQCLSSLVKYGREIWNGLLVPVIIDDLPVFWILQKWVLESVRRNVLVTYVNVFHARMMEWYRKRSGSLFRESKILNEFQLNILNNFVIAVKPNSKQRQQYFKKSSVNLPISGLQFSQYPITVYHHSS